MTTPSRECIEEGVSTVVQGIRYGARVLHDNKVILEISPADDIGIGIQIELSMLAWANLRRVAGLAYKEKESRLWQDEIGRLLLEASETQHAPVSDLWNGIDVPEGRSNPQEPECEPDPFLTELWYRPQEPE